MENGVFKKSFLVNSRYFRINSETAMKINSKGNYHHMSSRTHNLDMKLFLEGLKKI